MHACGLGYALALVVGLCIGAAFGALIMASVCAGAMEDARSARFAGDARRAP